MHVVLQLVNHINYRLDKGVPTIAVFVDFRKAFDCVSHSVVVDKLKDTNIGPDTVEWVEHYSVRNWDFFSLARG